MMKISLYLSVSLHLMNILAEIGFKILCSNRCQLSTGHLIAYDMPVSNSTAWDSQKVSVIQFSGKLILGRPGSPKSSPSCSTLTSKDPQKFTVMLYFDIQRFSTVLRHAVMWQFGTLNSSPSCGTLIAWDSKQLFVMRWTFFDISRFPKILRYVELSIVLRHAVLW